MLNSVKIFYLPLSDSRHSSIWRMHVPSPSLKMTWCLGPVRMTCPKASFQNTTIGSNLLLGVMHNWHCKMTVSPLWHLTFFNSWQKTGADSSNKSMTSSTEPVPNMPIMGLPRTESSFWLCESPPTNSDGGCSFSRLLKLGRLNRKDHGFLIGVGSKGFWRMWEGIQPSSCG